MIEIRLTLPLPHECRGFVLIPRPLCLVEYHNMIVRWTWVSKRLVTKVVNVLYECFDRICDALSSSSHARSLMSCQLIPRKRLTKHSN
jgi:hypothetical protein